jgi:hypothetical protein
MNDDKKLKALVGAGRVGQARRWSAKRIMEQWEAAMVNSGDSAHGV